MHNSMIVGDNLAVMTELVESVGPAIRCAYLDPPYNTGGSFAHYADDIAHDSWLDAVGLRIEAVRRLLAPDGSLWISIDDGECHHLKVLCDRIMGRANFVANVVWHKKYTVANDARWFSDDHDHILVYARHKASWRPNPMPRTTAMDARYSNPDGHPKGPWKATPLHAKSGRPGSVFVHVFRNGRTWSPPAGTYPRFTADSLKRMDDGDEIWFGRDGEAIPARKTFLSELRRAGPPPATVWTHAEVGHNHEAKNEARILFPDDPFSTPKPERLLQRILHLATDPGDVVLDPYAGSGTTAAVAHKMGRRWITIDDGPQLRTHAEPRLRAVVAGTDPGGITSDVGWVGGGSFDVVERSGQSDGS